MTDKSPQISGARPVRALERAGWYIARQDGSHAQIKRPGRPGVVTVSVHKSKSVPPGTLRRSLDETDISVARLEELL